MQKDLTQLQSDPLNTKTSHGTNNQLITASRLLTDDHAANGLINNDSESFPPYRTCFYYYDFS